MENAQLRNLRHPRHWIPFAAPIQRESHPLVPFAGTLRRRTGGSHANEKNTRNQKVFIPSSSQKIAALCLLAGARVSILWLRNFEIFVFRYRCANRGRAGMGSRRRNFKPLVRAEIEFASGSLK
jgi:hypothetical protein